MTVSPYSPAKTTLLALAFGESLSGSGLYLRSQSLPPWLGRVRREIEAEMIGQQSSSIPKPFSLNQSPTGLKPAPGDISEWTAWTAQLLIKDQDEPRREVWEQAWQSLAANRLAIKGRISILSALKNISEGMTAPQCGRFNPHYFDDAALGRAAIIGVFHRADEELALELATLDASYTQFEDGLWSALATAAVFSRAEPGARLEPLIESALRELPEDSMAEVCVTRALKACEEIPDNILDISHFLERDVCNHIYSYGNVAHEILACLLVILKKTRGDYAQMLACAALLPSAGASLLGLDVALAALLHPECFHTETVARKHIYTLRGESLPKLKGLDLRVLGAELAGTAGEGEPRL